ncbi:guanine deaminase [Halioxenophilus aromaticivorans]|uniref:Guanine deaminase n=1 Tax=Halioxenophilus aromaticivorans TaxID=1306992 RepID=A0AAV3TYZ6_9ALTE
MNSSATTFTAYRSSILHFTESPNAQGEGVEYFQDGVLILADGKVHQLGNSQDLLPQVADLGASLVEFPDSLIMPGFIDSHVHYPQVDVIGCFGEQLLDWLNNYTFPAEMRFAQREYADAAAALFLQQLLAGGTTTAMVYCTVHPQSVEAFFTASQALNTCMIAGKVLMDRNAPQALQDTAQSGYEQSQQLIDGWHNQGRQKYVVTPRFAPTSTPEQMRLAGKLLADNPGVYMQTHLSENTAELAWVRDLFPDNKHYLDVYDKFGLLGPTSVFGHGIHLSEEEWQRLADTGSGIAFCPTSNLFLGSGLFDLATARQHGVSVSLATDVGAGTSLCQLVTLNEAYKVAQLRGLALHPYEAFYWLTLGNAKALMLDDTIGNFEAGKTADFIVLNSSSVPLVDYRVQQCKTLWEKLFVMMTLGDDRLIQHTYIAGQQAYSA